MIERITGPFHGYHIATYACPMGNFGAEYLGQFKICENRPTSFWDAHCVHDGFCNDISPTSEMALRTAELEAMREIGLLPLRPAKLRRWGFGLPEAIGFSDSRPFALN